MLSWGFSTATDEIGFVAGCMVAGEIPSLIEDAEGACGTDITFQSLASSGKELVVSQILCLMVTRGLRSGTSSSRLLVESASSDKDVVVFWEAEPQYKHAIHELAGLWTHCQCHQVPICACLVQESDLDDGQEHGMDADHAPQTLEAAFAMAATTLSYNNATVRSIFLLANISPFQYEYDLTVVFP